MIQGTRKKNLFERLAIFFDSSVYMSEGNKNNPRQGWMLRVKHLKGKYI